MHGNSGNLRPTEVPGGTQGQKTEKASSRTTPLRMTARGQEEKGDYAGGKHQRKGKLRAQSSLHLQTGGSKTGPKKEKAPGWAGWRPNCQKRVYSEILLPVNTRENHEARGKVRAEGKNLSRDETIMGPRKEIIKNGAKSNYKYRPFTGGGGRAGKSGARMNPVGKRLVSCRGKLFGKGPPPPYKRSHEMQRRTKNAAPPGA